MKSQFAVQQNCANFGRRPIRDRHRRVVHSLFSCKERSLIRLTAARDCLPVWALSMDWLKIILPARHELLDLDQVIERGALGLHRLEREL